MSCALSILFTDAAAVTVRVYRAETVWLTIRYALAWHDFPEGGQWVDFYEPMNRSDQPMPKVELKLKGEEK